MASTASPGSAGNLGSDKTFFSRLAEGGHPWGELSVGLADRRGGVRYRLTVYPAGITADQRRALVFRRRWIPWGVVLWFVMSSALGVLMNGWVAFALGGAVYFGALLTANSQAGSARREVLEIYAQLLTLMGHREVFGDFDLLDDAAGRLLHLDERAAANDISLVEYELLWGEVYAEIARAAFPA